MAQLSYEQAPPLTVPFRFFLTAPVFGLLCAALLVWRGPEVFDSRWMPAALGATHLLTLGFLASVMTGAMMQILPVLVGAPLPAPRAVARLTHLGLVAGTLALAGGFVLLEPTLLGAAVVFLGAGFAIFVAAVVVSLVRVRAWNTTVGVMWSVVIALAATVTFGALLAASMGFGLALPTGALHDLHPGWGLLGWVGMLVIGVAYQVVPMFQMTPGYSDKLTSWLTWAIFAALVLWTIVQAMLGDVGVALAHGLALALAAGYATFALITLDLQRQRRRRLADVTLDFWRVGMVCLIVAAGCWAVRLVGIEALPQAFDVFLGVLAIVGVAVSVVNGMLYKIAPFLAWFHLQTQSAGRGTVPHMKKILGDAAQRNQFRVQIVALGLLLAAPWWRLLAYPAGVVLAVSMAMLLRNLLGVMRVHRETLARVGIAREAV
jgi:hypothetical protein